MENNAYSANLWSLEDKITRLANWFVIEGIAENLLKDGFIKQRNVLPNVSVMMDKLKN